MRGIEKTDAMGRQPELDIVHPEKEVSEEGSSVMKLDKGADEAGAFVGAAHGVAIDDETNRAILRKIDFRLMPIMSGLYLLQYLDKVTLSYAAVMDLMEDTGSELSLISSHSRMTLA